MTILAGFKNVVDHFLSKWWLLCQNELPVMYSSLWRLVRFVFKLCVPTIQIMMHMKQSMHIHMQSMQNPLLKSQQIQINSMKLHLPKIDEFSLSKLKWNTHDKITSNIDFHDCEQWYLSRVWFRNSKTQRTSAKLRAIPRPVLIMSVEALPSLITDKIRKTIFDPSIKNYLCICNNICLWNDTEHQIWKQRQMGIFCEKDLK